MTTIQEILNRFDKKFVKCRACEGIGHVGGYSTNGGWYECKICKGMGVKFSAHAGEVTTFIRTEFTKALEELKMKEISSGADYRNDDFDLPTDGYNQAVSELNQAIDKMIK